MIVVCIYDLLISVGTYMPWWTCKEQKTTFGNWFSFEQADSKDLFLSKHGRYFYTLSNLILILIFTITSIALINKVHIRQVSYHMICEFFMIISPGLSTSGIGGSVP